MSITNYTELQAAIADWLNRSDLTNVIPDFIALVDARLNRDQLTKETKEATIQDGTGDLFLNLFMPQPTNTLEKALVEARSLVVSGVEDPDNPGTFNPPLRIPIIQLTSTEQVYASRSFNPTASIPRLAAVQYNKILLSPLPDANYEYTLLYEGQEPLSDANPTNSALSMAPDVYLYGALAESAPYIKDDTRLPMWDARFQTALAELERARERREWPNTPVATQPRVFS